MSAWEAAATIDETDRRRTIQLAHNEKHGITPQTIIRSREEIMQATSVLEQVKRITPMEERPTVDVGAIASAEAMADMIEEMEKQMNKAAAELEFEKAANLRAEINRLREQNKKKAG